jgi:hypothetical protein
MPNNIVYMNLNEPLDVLIHKYLMNEQLDSRNIEQTSSKSNREIQNQHCSHSMMTRSYWVMRYI